MASEIHQPGAVGTRHFRYYDLAVHAFVVVLLVSNLVAQKIFVMAKMKILTKGKHLWSRTIGSTVVGQFVDTFVVIFIIFVGVQDMATMFNMIFTGYFAKVLYEAAATPLTYLIVNRLKKAEGIDIYDEGVDFNPFSSEQTPPADAS